MELNLMKNIFGKLCSTILWVVRMGLKFPIHRFYLRLLKFSHFVASQKQKNHEMVQQNSHG